MSTKKRLISNFLSLASVQGLNFVLPLVTLPYLLQVVGPSKFGLISFAQAFIQYFILFTDYGFNLVATRDISLARDNKNRLSKIFSTVMLIRIALAIVSLIVLIFLVLLVPKFHENSIIYFITFGMVIGNIAFPIWYFQGIEKMKIISILNVISKSIFTIGIFILVQEKADFLIVPILNSLGSITIGIVAIYIIIVKHQIKFIKPSKDDIVHQLKEGWHIFLSNVVTSLYTTSNIFILGFFASNTIVGYYSSAEKVVKAVASAVSPLIQTIYPFLSKALQESRERAILILNKMFIIVTISMGSLSLLVGVFAEQLVVIGLGPEYKPTIPLLQILSPMPLVLGWASIFGILTMINFDYKKQLSRIYIVSSILSIILMILLIPTYKEFGTAWNAIITEVFATLLMAIFLWKKGIHIWMPKLASKSNQ
ncbi:flippase [Robertmurraya korlensis]|uniref:flippase n=1 Tax=Robertmurraya korlensis TaxID=519977 RepID=UPI000826A4C5|nr:flippase [Robertmurraya korlensis]